MIAICLTVLAIVIILAVLAHELVKDATSTRLVLADKKRDDRRARYEHEREQAHAVHPGLTRRVAIADGAELAVHFDGKVVKGKLDTDDDDTIVLCDAAVVSGTAMQPLGGRQHIPRARVTQIQEL